MRRQQHDHVVELRYLIISVVANARKQHTTLRLREHEDSFVIFHVILGVLFLDGNAPTSIGSLVVLGTWKIPETSSSAGW